MRMFYSHRFAVERKVLNGDLCSRSTSDRNSRCVSDFAIIEYLCHWLTDNWIIWIANIVQYYLWYIPTSQFNLYWFCSLISKYGLPILATFHLNLKASYQGKFDKMIDLSISLFSKIDSFYHMLVYFRYIRRYFSLRILFTPKKLIITLGIGNISCMDECFTSAQVKFIEWKDYFTLYISVPEFKRISKPIIHFLNWHILLLYVCVFVCFGLYAHMCCSVCQQVSKRAITHSYLSAHIYAGIVLVCLNLLVSTDWMQKLWWCKITEWDKTIHGLRWSLRSDIISANNLVWKSFKRKMLRNLLSNFFNRSISCNR